MCVVDVFIVPTYDISEMSINNRLEALCTEGGAGLLGRGRGREQCLHLTLCPSYTSYTLHLLAENQRFVRIFDVFVSVK